MATRKLDQRRASLSGSLRSQVPNTLKVVSVPGPSTLRVRTALTDASRVAATIAQALQIELPAAQTVAGVRLDAAGRPSAFPKNFKVEGSLDGKKWFPLGASHGLYSLSEAYFEAKPTKFVKITLTDLTKKQPWAIQEVQLVAQK